MINLNRIKLPSALRFVLAVAACILFFSPAPAIVTPPRMLAPRAEKAFAPFWEIPSTFVHDSAYRMTEQTEVRLNGRKCKFSEVPDTAEIIFMEIDSDASRVILRIYFRDRK